MCQTGQLANVILAIFHSASTDCSHTAYCGRPLLLAHIHCAQIHPLIIPHWKLRISLIGDKFAETDISVLVKKVTDCKVGSQTSLTDSKCSQI